MDLHHFRSHDSLGETRGEGSSSWGWTNSDGREFVAIGQFTGTAFVEINSQGKMLYLGRLPAYSVGSEWREIRSYKNYMIIGSEAQNHGESTKQRGLDAVADPWNRYPDLRHEEAVEHQPLCTENFQPAGLDVLDTNIASYW